MSKEDPWAPPTAEEESTIATATDFMQQCDRKVLARLTEREKQRRHLIDPRSSNFLPWWDLLTGIALIYTAFVTPFEVAFLPTKPDALFPPPGICVTTVDFTLAFLPVQVCCLDASEAARAAPPSAPPSAVSLKTDGS